MRKVAIAILWIGTSILIITAWITTATTTISQWLREKWQSLAAQKSGIPTNGSGPHITLPDITFSVSSHNFQLLISLLLLLASLFIILSTKYGPKDKHWAYATVGTLLGFWLKP